jgi:hypothetical protein
MILIYMGLLLSRQGRHGDMIIHHDVLPCSNSLSETHPTTRDLQPAQQRKEDWCIFVFDFPVRSLSLDPPKEDHDNTFTIFQAS